MKKRIFLFLCLFAFRQMLPAQDFSAIRWLELLLPAEPQLMYELRSMGIEVDHFHTSEEGLKLTLSESDVAQLEESGIPYRVLTSDVTQDFLRANGQVGFYDQERSELRSDFASNCQSMQRLIQTPINFRPGSMGGYLTYEELLEQLDKMVEFYPQLISEKMEIGRSVEGRPILAFRISDQPNVEESEPNILYTGLHHAREAMSMHQLIFFMWYLLEHYDQHPEIREVIDQRALWFVPCVNPDGYVYNQKIEPKGGGMWRKNRRPNADGSTGVDLNRNYAIGWGDPDGSSGNGGSSTYRGTAPFSEPEALALRELAERVPFQIVMDYHSYGNLFIRPSMGFEAAPEDEQQYHEQESEFTYFNCYVAGDDRSTVGYKASGTSSDWHYYREHEHDHKTFAWIPEVGNSFWPTKDLIIPLARENFYPNLKAAQLAGASFELEENSPIALNTESQQLELKIRRLGLKDAAFSVEVEASGYLSLAPQRFDFPKGSLVQVGAE
ncbi:MAG: M14 family metallopeptidase, partial [Bacteroidota bacterium]